MKSDPIVRPAQSAEADRLTEIALRSKAYWGYSEDFMAACRDELSVAVADIEDRRSAYFVCELDRSIIGYFAMGPVIGFESELDALFVEPQYIGHGYGHLLMNRAKTEAFARGARCLLVQGDPHAEEFYRAAGGIPVGERESASIPGRYLPEFRIQLKPAIP